MSYNKKPPSINGVFFVSSGQCSGGRSIGAVNGLCHAGLAGVQPELEGGLDKRAHQEQTQIADQQIEQGYQLGKAGKVGHKARRQGDEA